MPQYFNNAGGDSDISNDANWWEDFACTIASSFGATSGQECHILAHWTTGSGAFNPGSLYFDSGTYSATQSVSCPVVITGEAIMGGSLTTNTTIIIEVAVSGAALSAAEILVSEGAWLTGATVTGNVTADGTVLSQVDGTNITGNLTFIGSYTDGLPSVGAGSVSGTTTFTGTVTFSGTPNSVSPTWVGTGSTWIFTDANNTGNFTCATATFNGASDNSGDITGAVTFTGSGNNSGAITGDVVFTGSGDNAAAITGNLTIASGTNSAAVSGDLTITGSGVNNGGSATNLTVPHRVGGYASDDLGTYVTLFVRASGGGGGPLGGPRIAL